MAKYIKNASGVNKTWVGQLVIAGEYYQVQPTEELAWMTNSILLVDIASGAAIVAKDASGTTNITDINSAIDYLKDNQPIKIDTTAPVRSFALEEGVTLRARLVGIVNATATKNSATNHDYQIPVISYGGVNKQAVMNGIEFYAKDAEIGDKISFQIVDVNNILGYGAGTVLDEFGKDWYVSPNTLNKIILYKANLIAGLFIRMVYTSTGTTNDVKLFCNLFRHIDTSVNT
jgi:hypothetical protein